MRNHEHYPDPTATKAIANVMREKRMELIETVSLMTSPDYKDRFKGEYYQLKIRYDKLKKMVDNWSSLDFKPTCHKEIYVAQCHYMKDYLDILKLRAIKENIEL